MKAEYIAHSGTDLGVCNAARVSFDKESEWEYRHGVDPETNSRVLELRPELAARDVKLVRYLAAHNHFTPFTHNSITLRETVPLFVARQRFKHVVGFTYNEVSRRYVDSEPEFYVPSVWRKRAEDKKQGSSSETVVSEACWVEVGYEREEGSTYKHFNAIALEVYNELLKDGVAPEQARMVLPQSTYTSYYVTGSLSAFARAYRLRSQPDAQLEIQELAAHWDTIIRPLFPISWSALVD